MTGSAANPAGRASGATAAFTCCPSMLVIAADTALADLALPPHLAAAIPDQPRHECRRGGSLE